MKIAVYPGSFNPWHDGHQEVLDKALQVFDRVVVAQGINPQKMSNWEVTNNVLTEEVWTKNQGNVIRTEFQTLLADFIKTVPNCCAIIKGLRNGQDLEYEKSQQYWNEDLGISVPVFYIISSRNLSHISSSAIRAVKKFRGEKNEKQ